MRREIEIKPAFINHGIGTLVEDAAPVAVAAEAGPEFKGHGLVPGDQSARQIDVTAAAAVEMDLAAADHGRAFQSAVGVADGILGVTVEAVAMLQRRSW